MTDMIHMNAEACKIQAYLGERDLDVHSVHIQPLHLQPSVKAIGNPEQHNIFPSFLFYFTFLFLVLCLEPIIMSKLNMVAYTTMYTFLP